VPLRATIRERNPGGKQIPFASGGSNVPTSPSAENLPIPSEPIARIPPERNAEKPIPAIFRNSRRFTKLDFIIFPYPKSQILVLFKSNSNKAYGYWFLTNMFSPKKNIQTQVIKPNSV
jgi:hypothetical protein